MIVFEAVKTTNPISHKMANSTGQLPSWEVDSCYASLNIRGILCNPNATQEHAIVPYPEMDNLAQAHLFLCS